MKIRNYCVLCLGKLDDKIKDDILSISFTNKPKYIEAKGVLIGTFTSLMTPAEIEDYLMFKNRSFLVFDLNKEHSGYFLDNLKIHTHLFGDLTEIDDKLINDLNSIKPQDEVDYIDYTIDIDYDNDDSDDMKTANDEIIKFIDKISNYMDVAGKDKGRIETPEVNLEHLTVKQKEILVNSILDNFLDTKIKKLSKKDKNILDKVREIK